MAETREDVVGVVAIGRNEGRRLLRCLASAAAPGRPVVYVDSGSTDGSVESARALGAEVVCLDVSLPFTAARARNAGLARLLELRPTVRYVQFVDGDCEIRPEWLPAASRQLAARPEVGMVCGRRRERQPERSCFNRLADMEWDTRVGETSACGGDALVRVSAFQAAGGYDARLIAGEDPELCLRLRRAGYKILRLDLEMTLHDAALLHWSQWWRRNVRAGHAFAEAAWLHGGEAERYRVRELASILFWGGGLPLLAVGLAWATAGWSLALLAGYPVLWLRMFRGRRERGEPARLAALYATACTIGKCAELRGAVQFAWTRWVARRPSTLIEYKGSGSAPPNP